MSDIFSSHFSHLNRPPFWFMRQAGRYLPEYRATRAKAGSFMDLCLNAELATEVTMQPIRRYGMDMAILFSDILIVPYALGISVEFVENEGPRVEKITSRDQLTKYPKTIDLERIKPVFEIIRNLRRELPAHCPLIGFAGAPWTVACYTIAGKNHKEFEAARMLAYGQPEECDAMIEWLTQATITYLSAQIEAGAQIIQLFDSWAGLLDSARFARYVIAPTTKITAYFKQHYPHIPLIGFARGAGANLLEYAAHAGVDMVGLDSQTPVSWAVKNITLPFQGNLDPLLLASDAKDAITQAKEILTKAGNKKFIFNLGHGIIPSTPPEHVQQLVEYWKALG